MVNTDLQSNGLRQINSSIPFTDFGGNGPMCHFAHANGYPPAAYLPMLKILAERCQVFAMHLRPLWEGSNPQEIVDWQPLANDLIAFLSTRSTGPVIGIGHSVGGTTTLRAALRRPDLFTMIILIDPVIFPPWTTVLWNLISMARLEYRVHPLVGGALRRKTEFESSEAMFANYRSKPVFSRFDDAALEAYVRALVRPSANGRVSLNYSPEWEARIYVTASKADLHLWSKLPTLAVPVIVLRGEQTDTFKSPAAALFRWRLPEAEIQVVKGAGHLLPLERPAETAALIEDFIARHTR
jgi:pimeloyl-ACP methyl ester carboxylesterase